jgi:hypothetical protein
MSEIVNNAAQNWDNFDPTLYHGQFLGEMLTDDRFLTANTITGMYAFCQANNVPLASFDRGIDYGNGGSTLSASYLGPLVRAEADTLAWADLGEPQLATARNNIQAGQRRQLGGWEQHQQYMGRINPAWGNAMYQACDSGTVVKIDGFNPEPNSTAVAKCSFFHESATSDLAEWKHGTINFFRSVTPGGLALVQFMIGSTGWSSAGEVFRSVDIRPEMLVELAEEELEGIQSYSYYKQPDAKQSARPEGDVHDYLGMGFLLGKRAVKATHIV